MAAQAGQQSVEYTLTMSGALNSKLNRIAAANGGDLSEVLAKAIALYEMAVTAQAMACSLAVLDANNQVQTKIERL